MLRDKTDFGLDRVLSRRLGIARVFITKCNYK